jgi:CDGSH-type Zn-finger protein
MFVTGRTKITALDNGPYLVKGPVVLLGADVNEFGAERAILALVRWDGTHKKVGFRAAERAVREEWGVGS